MFTLLDTDALPSADLVIVYPSLGTEQTFPRGEHSAIVALSSLAQEGSSMQYIGDNKPVLDNINKDPQACNKFNNHNFFG